MEDVGGFFASLKLMTDNSSFQQGMGAIKGLADGLTGLLEGGASLAGIAAALKGIFDAANKQGQLLLTGDYLDMSADAITGWGEAIDKAGGNAEGFVDSVKSMHRSLVQLYAQGKTNDALFLNLGLLLEKSGKSVDQFMKEGTNQQVWDIMQGARNYPDKQKGYEYLLSLLGPDALKAVQFSRKTGQGLKGMYDEGLSHVYTGDNQRLGALKGTAEVRSLFGNMGGIWEAFSALAMSDAAPKIKEMNDWMKANHENIKKGIDVAVGVAEIVLDVTNFGLLKGGMKGLSEWKKPNAPITSGEWWKAQAGNIGNVFSDMFRPVMDDFEKLLQRANIKIDLSAEAKRLLSIGQQGIQAGEQALGISGQSR